ncbi:MBL fold metallo-hydrolase [Oceaniserpentilla sp. 4NH20-0058]|uniref:MBL fold metallo-hydrolase n=1 Tax=Oceaniserpentilla sp. 4NH20-0058 TaxID=3127660 RepID=UPI0031049714
MQFCSVGSGSKGNGTLIQKGKTCILIDNGFTLKEFENRLAQKGLTPLNLSAILITHEHSDHIKGVGPLARKYRIPVYCSHGTAQHEGLGSIPSLQIFDSHSDLTIGELSVTPVVVPHDAREPTQFVVSSGEFKVGILTDLGSLTPHIVETYQECHGLLIETNHDVAMLRKGPYPPKLKVRVEGNLGHLNNEQAYDFLMRIKQTQLQYVVATHISEQNNQKDLAIQSIVRALNCDPEFVIMASQEAGFEWCELTHKSQVVA